MNKLAFLGIAYKCADRKEGKRSGEEMDRNLAVEGRTCCEKCLREAALSLQAEMPHPVQSEEAATQPLLWFTKERLAHSQPALLA